MSRPTASRARGNPLLRVLSLALLLVAAAFAGCTDKLGLNAAATLEEPAFDLDPETGDAKTVFRVGSRGLGERYNVTWDWGDGALSYGAAAEHRYGFTNGVMTVTMLVTDEAGKQGIATRTVTLGTGENQPPRVTARALRPWVEVGQTVNVTATGTDPDKDPLTYLWTYRALGADGQPTGEAVVLDSVAARAGVAFDAPGKYVVQARARDPKGGEAMAETNVTVSRDIPPNVFEVLFEGKLVAGTGGATVSEKAWLAPAPDTSVDAARHRFTLEYPGSTLVLLTWNDTTGQGAFDLDLELRFAENGTTVFRSETRAPSAPMEFNLTSHEPGEYELVVRGFAGADVAYTALVHANYRITPELVAARESGG